MDISASREEDGTVKLISGYDTAYNSLSLDWTDMEKSRRDAWMHFLCVFFQEESRVYGVGEIIREILVDLPEFQAKGYMRIDRKTYKVPKFRFASVEEFVLKASTMPEFADGEKP